MALVLLILKTSMKYLVFDQFWLVSNLSFLNKVIEWVVAFQNQRIIEEMDYLDPFNICFRPGSGLDVTLVALVNYLFWVQDRGHMSLLILLDFSAAFYTMVSFGAVMVIWRGHLGYGD